jgi:hypothetical protein
MQVEASRRARLGEPRDENDDEKNPSHIDPVTGQANVKRDGDGFAILKDGLSCDDSRPCDELRKYRGLLDFTRDTASNLGFPEPGLQIIQPPD